MKLLAKLAPGESGAVAPAGTVLAVSGRRIDPEGADQPGFPAGNEALVAFRIRNIMLTTSTKVVVCSGACGADILALEAAGQLGLSRRLVLPFPRQEFRSTSVADRGEDWGRRFDAILQQLPAEHIVELNLQQSSALRPMLQQTPKSSIRLRDWHRSPDIARWLCGLEWTQPGFHRLDRSVP
jgi:hypothetical protein